MDFKGRYAIPAPSSEVWAALHDPKVLQACIPGAEDVTRLSDTEYRATATVKVGPVKARFQAKVTWADAPPSEGATHAGVLSGEGQGGAVGFARGDAKVMLAPGSADVTILTYEAKATIGGKLAQIGQRLIDSTAKSLADEFFSAFATLMRDTNAARPPDAAANAVMTPERAAPVQGQGFKAQIWVAGLIGIVFILLLLFSLVL